MVSVLRKARMVDPNPSWMEDSLESTEMFIVATVDAAESLGYGIVYTGGIRNNPEKVSELLHLPNRTYPLFGLCIGVPVKDKIQQKKPRLPQEAIFFDDRYPAFEKTVEHIDKYDEKMREYYQTRATAQSDRNWSETMTDKRKVPRRLNMKPFLQDRGFLLR